MNDDPPNVCETPDTDPRNHREELDADDPADVREFAEFLHDEYERAAKQAGWDTQDGTTVPFDDLPRENQETMLRLTLAVLQWYDVRPSAMHASIDGMINGD